MEKSYYSKKIRTEKYSLEQLAAEQNISVGAIRAAVKKTYISETWANKLIGIAEENGKHSDVSAPKAFVPRKVRAVVDTCFVLNYPEVLDGYNLVIPKFCMSELQRISDCEKDPAKKKRLEEILQKQEMEVFFDDHLPPTQGYIPDCKPRNITFVRYVKKLREMFPRIKVLTCSREVKEILTANGIRH